MIGVMLRSWFFLVTLNAVLMAAPPLEGNRWSDVLLPGIGMGLVIGALFIGFMLFRIRFLRVSDRSKKALEEMNLMEEEREGTDHDETAG